MLKMLPVYERMKQLDRDRLAGEDSAPLLARLRALQDELANVPASKKYAAAAQEYGRQLREKLEA